MRFNALRKTLQHSVGSSFTSNLVCVAGRFPYIPFFDPASEFVEAESSYPSRDSPTWKLLSDVITLARPRQVFRIETESPNCRLDHSHVSFSRDLQLLAVSEIGERRSTLVYDIRQQALQCRITGSSGYAMSMIPEGHLVSKPLVVAGQNPVGLFSALRGNLLLEISRTEVPLVVTRRVLSCCHNPSHLLMCGKGPGQFNGLVSLHNLTKGGARVRIYSGHSEIVGGIACDQRSSIFYSASGSLRAWSLKSRNCCHNVVLSNRAHSIFCATDSNVLMVGMTDGVEIWDPRRLRQCQQRISAGTGTIEDIDQIDGSQSYIVGSYGGEMSIVDVVCGKKTHRRMFPGPVTGVRSMNDSDFGFEADIAGMIESRFAFVVSFVKFDVHISCEVGIRIQSWTTLLFSCV